MERTKPSRKTAVLRSKYPLQIVTRVPQKTSYQQPKNNKIESNKEKHRKLLTFNCLWLLFQGMFPVCTDIP